MDDSANAADKVLATTRALITDGMSAAEILQGWRARKEGRNADVPVPLAGLDDLHLRGVALAASWVERALRRPSPPSPGALFSLWGTALGGNYVTYFGARVSDAELAMIAPMTRGRRLDMADPVLQKELQSAIRLGWPVAAATVKRVAFVTSFVRVGQDLAYGEYDIFTGDAHPITLDAKSVDHLCIVLESAGSLAHF